MPSKHAVSHSDAEIDALIREQPQGMRRFCTNKICACAGCINTQSATSKITQKEFNAWAVLHPLDTADAQCEENTETLAITALNRVKTSGCHPNDAVNLWRQLTGVGQLEAIQAVRHYWQNA